MTDLCYSLGIKHRRSPAYHPQCNGAVERANQTLKNRLYASEHISDWDLYLDEIIHTINCSTNAVTGMTPFEIETGHPGSNLHDTIQHNVVRENIQERSRIAKKRILKEKKIRNKKFSKPSFKAYEIGKLVLMRNLASKIPRFLGPLKIIEVRAAGISYKLEHVETGIVFIRHCSQLKPYFEKAPDISVDQEQEDVHSSDDQHESENEIFFMAEDEIFIPYKSDNSVPLSSFSGLSVETQASTSTSPLAPSKSKPHKVTEF